MNPVLEMEKLRESLHNLPENKQLVKRQNPNMNPGLHISKA